jgi:hypothetical protein
MAGSRNVYVFFLLYYQPDTISLEKKQFYGDLISSVTKTKLRPT